MGKYEKKRNDRPVRRRKKSRKNRRTAMIGIALICILAAVALLMGGRLIGGKDKSDVGFIVTPETEKETKPDNKELNIDLGQKLYVTAIGKYAGVYMEDGSDDLIDNVLMIRLENRGEKVLEYAEITLTTASGDAHFSVSTLEPEASVILLEKNRMPFDTAAEYGSIKADFAAFFEKNLELSESKLKIQQLDGAMNISNISEADISGPVQIYYKNYTDGIYYGGITYRVTLEEGIKAGELRQIMANHFYRNGSKILSVVCNENR